MSAPRLLPPTLLACRRDVQGYDAAQVRSAGPKHQVAGVATKALADPGRGCRL
jgi:hypothetical protein